MSSKLPLLPPPAACIAGKSWAPLDEARIERLAERVVKGLAPLFEDSVLTLVGFQAPYADPTDAPAGYLEVWFHGTRGLAAALTLYFSATTDELAYELEDWTLETARDLASGADPHEHSVGFANFDESWRFICRVGERLKVSQVRLHAGC